MTQTLIKQKERRLLKWLEDNPIYLTLQDLEEKSGTVVFEELLKDFEEEDEDYGFSLNIVVGYQMEDQGFDHAFGYQPFWVVSDTTVEALELRCNDEIVFIDHESYYSIKSKITAE